MNVLEEDPIDGDSDFLITTVDKKYDAITPDGAHLVAVRGIIHKEVPTRVHQCGQLNRASKRKSSDQQIFSTMSRPESTQIRQD